MFEPDPSLESVEPCDSLLATLLKRRSHARLQAPAPSKEEMNLLLQAAINVPDHAQLKPFRFAIYQGDGLQRLGDYFKQTSLTDGMSEEAISRAQTLPLRAPMVVVISTKFVEHEKVPAVEQVATTACAVYAMQLAAENLGYQSIWRTGSYAHSDTCKQHLGMDSKDEIIGFLYLGTAEKTVKAKRPLDPNQFTQWYE